MKNMRLNKARNMTAFRKFSISSWKDSYDPNTSIIIELKMENALKYIKTFRKEKKLPIIMLHLFIKAIADGIARVPEINATLRFQGLYNRDGVTVGSTIATAAAGSEDGLCNIRIQHADTKPIEEIVVEANERIRLSRNSSDSEDAYATLGKFPVVFLRPILWLLHFLMFKLNLHLPFLKLEKDPYGIAEITYIGALGLDNVILPLTPYSGVPIVIGPGVIRDMPFAVDGKVVALKGMRVSLSMDHRFADGFHAAKVIEVLKAYIENPFEHFDKESTGNEIMRNA